MSSEFLGRFFRAAPSGEKFTKSLSYKWTQECDVVRAWVLVPLCLVSAGWTPEWPRRTRTTTSEGRNLEFSDCLCVGWTNVGCSPAGYPLSMVCLSLFLFLLRPLAVEPVAYSAHHGKALAHRWLFLDSVAAGAGPVVLSCLRSETLLCWIVSE